MSKELLRYRLLRLRRSLWGRASLPVGLLLLLVNLVLVNYLAGRHYIRADWTQAQVFSLSDKTKSVLAALRRPLTIKVLMARPERLAESVYDEVRELLTRFERYSKQVSVEFVDVDTDRERVHVLSRRYRISALDLRDGVVVFVDGERSKVVPSRLLASYEVSERGRRITAFRGESEFLSAVLSVTSSQPTRICFTTGHGEAPTDTYAEAGYGYIVDEVRRDGFDVRDLPSDALVNGIKGCDVVVVGGPTRAFAKVELETLDRYLRRAGRLFVLLGPLLDRGLRRYRRCGLEDLLAGWGVSLPRNVVLDYVSVPGEQPPLTWATREGYGTHPITADFFGRLTVWPLAREVRPRRPAHSQLLVESLVRTSSKGWAEADLGSLAGRGTLHFDPAVDSPGPVTVAVAVEKRRHNGSRDAETRLVVFGSERGVLNKRMGGPQLRDYNRDLFLSALAWLAGKAVVGGVGPKTPEHAEIVADERQLGRVFLIVVVAMPVMALCCGIVVWRRRRR